MSGLISRVLTQGTSTEKPSATGVVTTDYTGWTTDGKMFDSSLVRGTTFTTSLDDVVEGWKEASS